MKRTLRLEDDFVFALGLPNGLRYLRWGGGRRSRPTGKMIRRVKLLEICADSPASGARFVGRFFVGQEFLPEKDDTANMPKFYK